MQVAANGQRSRSTQFMLDGHQMNDITIGGPSIFFQNLDQVAEYQVITNQFDASLGRNLGATVNIITKGGGNDIHGEVFWEHRNDNLNARTSLESQANGGLGRDNPELKDNRFGFNLGGPVIKDRLFLYGGYRGRRQPGATSTTGTSSARALTPAGIATLTAAFPASIPLQVYAQSGPFAMSDGNPTCATGTTTLLTLGGTYTNPITGASTTIPTVPGVEACGVFRTIPSNTEEKEYSIRADFNTTKHALFGRWLWRNNTFCCSGGQNGYFIDIPDKQKSLTVTHIWYISNRMTNNFKFSYAEFGVSFEGGNTEPISNVRANLSSFSMPAGFLGFGLATNLPQNRFLDTFQYANTWSYSVGRHSMKAGVEFQRNLTTLFFLPFINGSYSFTQANLADFLNNTPQTVNFAAGNGSFDPREFDQFYFFQDDWRILPNFTINLGIRYENNGQPINQAVDEIFERESNSSTAFWLQSVPIDQRTMPRLPNDNNNWAPRIGFAWTPTWNNWLTGNGQTTIRGGYGIAYELAFYNILLNMTTAAPRVFSFSLSGTSSIPVAGQGLGSDIANVIPVPVNTIDPRTLFQTRMSPDFHNPYGQNWSLGIQREVGRTQVFEIRYVGTNGIGLFQSRNANPLFRLQATNFASTVQTSGVFPSVTPCSTAGTPGFNRIDCTRTATRERINSARSNYNALQMRYDLRNFKNQFTSTVSYTWSKGIDNVSEIFGFFADGSIAFAQNPFDIIQGERGVSNQNLGQTLALSYIWETPWFRSQNGILGHILGGWSVNGISTFLSGRPFTPAQLTVATGDVCNEDQAFISPFVGLLTTCRPFAGGGSNVPLIVNIGGTFVRNVGFVDAAGVIHQGSATGPAVQANQVAVILNSANARAFFSPTNPFGVGRNNFRGEPTYNWDIAFDKNTKVTEQVSIRFRAAMLNAFSHRNFGVPSIRADLATFGDPGKNDVGGRSVRFLLWVKF
jgi:hypothetical protein